MRLHASLLALTVVVGAFGCGSKGPSSPPPDGGTGGGTGGGTPGAGAGGAGAGGATGPATPGSGGGGGQAGAGGSGGASGGTPGGAASPCDGMMPSSLGAPIEVRVESCNSADGGTTHPSGAVALGTAVFSRDGETWFPYTASGSAAGAGMEPIWANTGGRDTYFHPVANGFRGVVVLRDAAGTVDVRVRTWSLSGQLVSELRGARTIAPLPDGGSIAVLAPPDFTSKAASLAWMDAAGRVTRTVTLDDDADRVIVNWETGHVFAFIPGLSSRPTQGRWYDAAGSPLTPWFNLHVDKGSGGYLRLLADGVVAVGTLGQPWLTAVRDGVAGTEPLPAWLAARPGTRLVTIRGGRGYAVLPATGLGSLEIVTTDGQSCGTVAPAQPSGDPRPASWPAPALDVGWDGTLFEAFVTELDPSAPFSAQRCAFRWWPALLR